MATKKSKNPLTVHAVHAVLSRLKLDTASPILKVVLDTNNPDYLKHRAIEAIVANDILLAGRLIVAYLALKEPKAVKKPSLLKTSVTPVVPVEEYMNDRD